MSPKSVKLVLISDVLSGCFVERFWTGVWVCFWRFINISIFLTSSHSYPFRGPLVVFHISRRSPMPVIRESLKQLLLYAKRLSASSRYSKDCSHMGRFMYKRHQRAWRRTLNALAYRRKIYWKEFWKESLRQGAK